MCLDEILDKYKSIYMSIRDSSVNFIYNIFYFSLSLIITSFHHFLDEKYL